MVCEGERLLATPAGVVLSRLDDIGEGCARNFVLQLRAGRFHGFVVRQGGQVFGYVDRCPHMHLPLAQALDAYLSPSGQVIQCSWHGAVFEIATGRCLGGPCAGQRLVAWPVTIADGHIVTC